MIADSIIVPGGISSTDGYVCAASKILEELGFTDFFFKNWYNWNLKLGMMCKITQLWPVGLLLPLLCQVSCLVLQNFFAKKPSLTGSTYLSDNKGSTSIFHQRQEFKFEKFYWAEVVLWYQYCNAYLNSQPQRKEI